MRDFDSIKQKEMGSIENRVRHIYNRGYEDGLKDGKESLMDTYNAGLDDAWDAARKIICDGGNSLKSEQIIEIFGCAYFYEIFDKYSVSEVIAKIKEYEKKQEKQEKIDDEIKVGDEVYIIDKSYLAVVTADIGDRVVIMSCNGKYSVASKNILHKTGRHFPEIAEIMRKMQEVK